VIFRVIDDRSPLPPPGATEEEDAILLQDEAYIDGPIKVDYGTNLRYILLASLLQTPCSILILAGLVRVSTLTSTAPSSIPA
jgi:hypothetical protein